MCDLNQQNIPIQALVSFSSDYQAGLVVTSAGAPLEADPIGAASMFSMASRNAIGKQAHDFAPLKVLVFEGQGVYYNSEFSHYVGEFYGPTPTQIRCAAMGLDPFAEQIEFHSGDDTPRPLKPESLVEAEELLNQASRGAWNIASLGGPECDSVTIDMVFERPIKLEDACFITACRNGMVRDLIGEIRRLWSEKSKRA